MHLLPLLLSFLTLTLTSASPLLPRQQQACNRYPEFCDRKYSNITQIGTHNSAFVGRIPDPRINQEKSLTEQLDAGIRFLQAQTHLLDFDPDTLRLCHSSCFLLDSGPLDDYLETLHAWLTAPGNENEVITLLLTNRNDAPASIFDAAFASAALKPLTFTPNVTAGQHLPQTAWPTLAEMIAADDRLVVFVDYLASDPDTPYLLPSFAAGYWWETPFDVTDPNFQQCAFDRPADGSIDDRMLLLNHFLGADVVKIGDATIRVPAWGLAARTNAAGMGAGSIGAQVRGCENEWGVKPKAVLVDFFDKGDVFEVERVLNGLGGGE